MEFQEHTEANKAAMAAQAEIIANMEQRRKMASMVVPTDGGKIRAMLRALREPITLFGERDMERRERLRKLLAGLDDDRREALTAHLMEVEVQEQVAHVEKFYTEGPASLRALRLAIAQFAAGRARARLEKARLDAAAMEDDDEDEGALVLKEVKQLANSSSQIGSKRPIQGAAITPDNTILATASWSGGVSMWSMENLQEMRVFAAHEERCTDIAWHPEALSIAEDGTERPAESVCFATACADGSAKCWNMAGSCLHVLKGHTDRLARLAFHPAGTSLATSSFDGTWRLWEVETGECLMEQEGHSRSVYTVAFHRDGSLCGSGGMDTHTRIWDCRTGRNIMTFQGHVKPVLALDFSANGFHVATGSEDNSVRIWDLRKKGGLYTIAAHRKLVSQVRFEPISGHYLLTTSYDRTAKVWSTIDWTLQTTLAGHEDKIMSADISKDGTNTVVTVGFDKTVKLWQPEQPVEIDGLAPMENGSYL